MSNEPCKCRQCTHPDEKGLCDRLLSQSYLKNPQKEEQKRVFQGIGEMLQVRLSVRGMEHSIIQAITDYYGEFQARAKELVAQAVAHIDFDREVRDFIRNRVLEMVRWEVESRVNKLVRPDVIAKAVEKEFLKSLKSRL